MIVIGLIVLVLVATIAYFFGIAMADSCVRCRIAVHYWYAGM
jgi:hypothetical protein